MFDHSKIGKDGLVQIDKHIVSVMKTGCVLSHPDPDPFFTKQERARVGLPFCATPVTLGLSPASSRLCLDLDWAGAGGGEATNRTEEGRGVT